MLEAALTSLGWVASDQLVGGKQALRHGNDNAISSPSGTFRTGHGLLNIATNTNEQFERLCKALGVAELAQNPLFATRELRREHRNGLRDRLEAVLREKTAADWEIVLEEARVPAGRVLTVAEALDQDQVRARGLKHRVEIPVPSTSSVQIFGSGVHVDGKALAPQSPPPKLGEHTTQILAWLGYNTDQIDTLVSEGAV
jgi:crotonobetainyl-CoA:carnitine CoA-transferase CaiB-like acyl-CoA transferase